MNPHKTRLVSTPLDVHMYNTYLSGLYSVASGASLDTSDECSVSHTHLQPSLRMFYLVLYLVLYWIRLVSAHPLTFFLSALYMSC
jgi:hypothetical protein